MSDNLEGVENAGLIEDEKTFVNNKLGGSFTFRLPFIMDELTVLRRRAGIVGVREDIAGQELMALAHARAMFEVFCVHMPRGFKLDKQRVWQPFMELMMEVRDWHDTFRKGLEPKEESNSETKSEEPSDLVSVAV